jgi:hypothetical protein
MLVDNLNTDSRTTWFSYWGNSPEKEMLDEYRLLGKLIGLAFYNGVTLDFNFTTAIYKRLLGQSATLNNLKAFDPVRFLLHRLLQLA